MVVLNKKDLINDGAQDFVGGIADMPAVYMSTKAQQGEELLVAAIKNKLGVVEDVGVFAARARHVEALESAYSHISAASMQTGVMELCAEELRLAQDELSKITGKYTADDLLGKIFSEFCIGK